MDIQHNISSDDNGMDMALVNEHESDVVTLEPSSSTVVARPSSSRRKKGVNNFSNSTRKTKVSETLPGVFEPVSYNKFLTIKLNDIESDMFEIHRDIVKCCGREPRISSLNKQHLLVEANSPEESRKLLSLSALGGVLIECTPHANLNQSRGLIFAPQLLQYSEEKLERELEAQGVVKVQRLKKKIGGALTPLCSLILTFDSVRLPEYIKAAWFKYKIKQYIPRPRRCFYCQEFGHVNSTCRSKAQGKPAVCINCGNQEHGECIVSPQCIHCGGNHPSSYNGCDIYIFEKEVQATRVTEKLTFSEARQKVKARSIRPGVSFARVLAESNTVRKTRLNNHPTLKVANIETGHLAPRLKRNRSVESVAEPPSKSCCSNTDLTSCMPAPAVSSASASLGETSAVVDVTSLETASLLDETHSSLEAASAQAGAVASLEVASAPADALASLEAASAPADVLASSEAASAPADARSSSEVPVPMTDMPASSEAVHNDSLEVKTPLPMETDLAGQPPTRSIVKEKVSVADEAKKATPARAQRKQTSSNGKKLVRNPTYQGSKIK